MNVIEALHTRTSIRAFTPAQVTEAQVRAVLDAARWAPSGGNLQPWKVIVVAGEARQAVSDLAAQALTAHPEGEGDAYPVYPANLWDPYRTRRYELGEAMYEKLGIPREDKPARLARLLENFNFFGAPVGLFFVIDRRMGHGQWAHMGMFMQSIALAAVELGLGSCMQEAWGAVRQSLGAHFGLSEHDVLYCGMALGHPDREQAVNSLRSTRIEVDEFVTFRGFGAQTAPAP